MRSMFKPAVLFAFVVLAIVMAVYGTKGAIAAPEKASTPAFVGGHWTPGNGPYAVMNGDRNSAFFGISKSQSSTPFAIAADRDHVWFQVIDEAGGYHHIPVTALLKLVDQPVKADKPAAKSPSDAPVAGDGIPANHRFLYGIARARAAEELAKKEKISRRAAREKIDDALTDAQLHDLVKSAPIPIVVKAVGGKLTDFLEWLAAHQDVIMAIVAIIMSLFQANADVADSKVFTAHDWCGLLVATAA